MTRYLVKEPTEERKGFVYSGEGLDRISIPLSCLEPLDDVAALGLREKSAHAISAMIQTRDTIIKGLRIDVANARIGGQPASQLRDAVLPVLREIQQQMEGSVGTTTAQGTLGKLIAHLKKIPSLEPPADKMAEKPGGKPYKPLDHGPRDNDAAAPQYRFHQDQPNTLEAKAAAHRTQER